MELLSAVMQDTRFMDAYNKRIEEGRPMNMDAWIDEAENRRRTSIQKKQKWGDDGDGAASDWHG